jgi:aspartate/methionine/tyrosine aminotransferase
VFSSRVPVSLAPNALSTALTRRRAAGAAVVDLTVTNPTEVEIAYPAGLLDALSSREAVTYRPDPAGSRAAREWLAEVLGALAGGAPSPDDLLLTASTSEAYAVLFKLLCDAGDAVLVPQPSYPLFEHLAALENVVTSPYRLARHWDWGLDFDSLDAAWTPRARAVVVVSPNNPTGSMVREEERRRLLEWCDRRAIALIVDEVFRWYPLAAPADAALPFLRARDASRLVFALDGLSKSCGLPQVKLAWIQVAGRADLVAEARRRLDLILDTYLSVSTPVQVALPALWRRSEAVRLAIQARLLENLDHAKRIVGTGHGLDLVIPAGGWSAALRVPAVVPEETLAIELLEREGVLVHPGYFFDFPQEAYLVISLLPRPGALVDGLSRVVRHCRIA